MTLTERVKYSFRTFFEMKRRNQEQEQDLLTKLQNNVCLTIVVLKCLF